MTIPGQPPYGSPDFARWLNGPMTRFCGVGLHDRCKGAINTIGIECSCLCDCHDETREPEAADLSGDTSETEG